MRSSDNDLTRSPSSEAHPYSSITTERIMRAVEQQRRITDQLVGLQAQQQARVARVKRAGKKLLVAMIVLTAVVTLGLLILFIFLPDQFLAVLSFSSGAIDIIVQLARYVSPGLAFITQQNWFLAGAALVIVVMVGIWIHLMRTPQEA
jgi:hypothetical protein